MDAITLQKFFKDAEKHKKDCEKIFDIEVYADAWYRKHIEPKNPSSTDDTK